MSRRERLLFWGELPPKTLTGVSMSNNRVCTILREAGFTIHKVEEYTWNTRGGMKIFRLFQNFFRLVSYVLRNPYRVFYFNVSLSGFGLFKVLLMVLPFRLFRRRTQLVGHLHRGDFQQFAEDGRQQRVLLLFVLRRLSKLIVLSERYKEQVQAVLPRLDVAVLANTSDFEHMAAERAAIFQEKPYSRNFLCIANYLPGKGLQDLVSAFSSPALQTFSLTVHGSMYDRPFYQILKESATSNIQLLESVAREDLPDTLTTHDALIVPSWNEGQPITILEAMSLGVPVLSTHVGDISDMLGSDYPYLFPPRVENRLVEAVLSFDKATAKRQLSTQLQERYRTKFANDLHKQQVLSIFAHE
jgi:glycosyltransferase involved in cell wall biosynthesis